MTKEAKPELSMCARCSGEICYPRIASDDPMPDVDQAPKSCPMRRMTETMKKAAREYEKQDIKEFARLASIQEAQCYDRTPEGIRTLHPRVDELIMFSQKCRYTKIGLAFCAGLLQEARMLVDILERKGFEVVSVRCKTGGVPKESIGITEEQKISGPGKMETMCNPIAQAMILNEEQIDLAVMLGLCIGHDTLFIKYCKVPMTVLAVKDRVLAHNPLAALYLSSSPYYGRMKRKADKAGKGEKKTTIGGSHAADD